LTWRPFVVVLAEGEASTVNGQGTAMKTAAADKQGAEARRMPRKALRTLAEIIDPNTRAAIECAVLDMSSTGARLSVHSAAQKKAFQRSVEIPTEFCLQIGRDNIAVDCRKAWQRDGEIGVEFTSGFRPIHAVKAKATKPAGGLRKVR
jgi:hypothetical protein